MLQRLSKAIEDVLLPRMRISIELSAYNSGKSSTALYPYVGLKILHRHFDRRAFVLAAKRSEKTTITPSENMLLSMLKQKKEGKGKDIVVNGLLPETSASPYIEISPERLKEFKLVATEPIGSEDIKLVNNEKISKLRVVAFAYNSL